MKKWGLQWGLRLNPPEQIEPSSVLEMSMCKNLDNESTNHFLFYMLDFAAFTAVCRHTGALDKNIETWRDSFLILSALSDSLTTHVMTSPQRKSPIADSQSSATLRSAVTAAAWAQITPDVQWINTFTYCSFGDWKANQAHTKKSQSDLCISLTKETNMRCQY